MYIFLVSHHRIVNPQDGQQKIEQIVAAARQQNVAASGWTPIKIPGVTRYENPFPDWLAKLLTQAGCQYDDVNMVWYLKTNSYEQGIALLAWFEQQVRPWASNDRAWTDYMQFVTSRLLEDDNYPDLVTY